MPSLPADHCGAADAALAEVYAVLREVARRHAATDQVAASCDGRALESAPRTSRGAVVESSPSPSKQGANDVDSVAHCVTSDASDRSLGAESRPGLAGQSDVCAKVSW